MKTLLFIFLFSLFLKADSYIFLSSEQMSRGFCVKDYKFSGNQLHFIPSGSSNDFYNRFILIEYKNIQIFSNYSFNPSDGTCSLNTLDDTKIFMSSLIGILIGFSILFFSIFLTIKIGAKK